MTYQVKISQQAKQIVTILRIMYCGRDIPHELHNSKLN